jgi:hypothetical protein
MLVPDVIFHPKGKKIEEIVQLFAEYTNEEDVVSFFQEIRGVEALP